MLGLVAQVVIQRVSLCSCAETARDKQKSNPKTKFEIREDLSFIAVFRAVFFSELSTDSPRLKSTTFIADSLST